MKLKINKKTIVGIVAVLIAFGFSFIFLPFMYKDQKSTMEVVSVNKTIRVGDQIKSNDLTKKAIGKYGVSKDVITDSNQVVNKYATTIITPNDNIYPEKISDTLKKAEQTNALAKGKVLVTVTLNTTAAGLAGFVEKGDIVSVASCRKGENGQDATIQRYPDLEKMEVHSVTNKALQETSKVASDPEMANSESAVIPANITFVATPEQAAQLLKIEYSGNVHVILKEKALKKEDK